MFVVIIEAREVVSIGGSGAIVLSALVTTLGICEAGHIIWTTEIGRGNRFRGIIISAVLVCIDKLIGKPAEAILVRGSLAGGRHGGGGKFSNPVADPLVCNGSGESQLNLRGIRGWCCAMRKRWVLAL
jgi:hypothetical protein